MAIKIPQNGKLSQPNNSDLFGNLWYTKNINLDEEGYIKLSPRSVSILDSGTDTNFNIPVSFGRQDEDLWHIATVEKNFEVDISLSAGITAAQDNGTSVPTNSFDSRACWWQNKWHVTDADDLFYKTISTGNWTDANVTLASGEKHDVEVFRNRNTLCITNANVVVQVNTSYSTSGSSQLTIPADFEAHCLAYNNNQMAIGTMLSGTGGIVGQNQEAYLFIWDGETTSANAGYAVGSDMIIAVEPYKSSFVILTRAGELKYFNGGGFDVLAQLPLYFQKITWGDSRNLEALGNILLVDGDIIYININNANALVNAPGGILCYDPKIGLYHRYSLSISSISNVVVGFAGVDSATNVFTKTSGTIAATGSPVKYLDDGEFIVPELKSGKVYFTIKLSSTTFQLATTYEEAMAGAAINITAPADSSLNFIFLTFVDFGATYIDRTGGIGMTDSDSGISDNGSLIFGGELIPVTGSGNLEYLNILCSGFENRGYFVTPKIQSRAITEVNQKIFIKYRPLDTNDKIVIKYKDKEVIGLPSAYSTGYPIIYSWLGTSTLTASANLSEAKDFIDAGGELELEVVSGAGAGTMVKVSSITYASSVYSIELEEDVLGVTAGNVSRCFLDNWKKLGEIISTDVDGYKEFPISSKSPWIKFKVELRGSETTVEELQFVSQEDKKPV